jgi:hypothetical protein
LDLLLRFVGGFGGLADAANRAVARVLPGKLGRVARRQPIGIALVVGLVALFAAAEVAAAAPYLTPMPVDLHALATTESNQDAFVDSVAASAADRNASITGVLASQYIVTFEDSNNDHIKEANEVGVAWLYFLRDPKSSIALVVDSEVPPAARPPTGSTVTLQGRLTYAFGGVDLGFLGIPNLKTLPFQLVKFRLNEGAGFAQVDTAREAVIALVVFAFLSIAAWRLGYLPFRRSGGALGGQSLHLDEGRPMRARLTGLVEHNGHPEFTRNEEVVARVLRDPFGQPSLTLTPFSDPRPIGVIKTGDRFDVGVALSLRGRQYAMRSLSPRAFIVGFESISERDAVAAALLHGLNV